MNSKKQLIRANLLSNLVAVPDTDHKDASVLVEAINYKVCLEGMDSNRRRNLMPLTRRSWIAGD